MVTISRNGTQVMHDVIRKAHEDAEYDLKRDAAKYFLAALMALDDRRIADADLAIRTAHVVVTVDGYNTIDPNYVPALDMLRARLASARGNVSLAMALHTRADSIWQTMRSGGQTVDAALFSENAYYRKRASRQKQSPFYVFKMLERAAREHHN